MTIHQNDDLIPKIHVSNKSINKEASPQLSLIQAKAALSVGPSASPATPCPHAQKPRDAHCFFILIF